MAAFMAALPAFLAALPTLFQIAAKFMNLIVKLVEWSEKEQTKKWIENVEKSFDDLHAADTPEKKYAAARRLNDVFRGLG